MPSPPPSENPLPITDGPQETPVFTCHVLLRHDTKAGVYVGRVANVPELTCEAGSERIVLQQLVGRFKDLLSQRVRERQPLPEQSNERPAPNEYQRWIPVHL